MAPTDTPALCRAFVCPSPAQPAPTTTAVSSLSGTGASFVSQCDRAEMSRRRRMSDPTYDNRNLVGEPTQAPRHLTSASCYGMLSQIRPCLKLSARCNRRRALMTFMPLGSHDAIPSPICHSARSKHGHRSLQRSELTNSCRNLRRSCNHSATTHHRCFENTLTAHRSARSLCASCTPKTLGNRSPHFQLPPTKINVVR